MPYCQKCGEKYEEDIKFCNNCGDKLLAVEKKIVKIKSPESNNVQKKELPPWAKLVRVAAAVFFLIIIVSFFVSNQNQKELDSQNAKLLAEQTARQEAISRYNDYVDIINNDIAETKAISNKYSGDLTNDQYVSYVNEYTVEATYQKQHLLEWRDFIDENDEILRKAEINTIEKKAEIDSRLANIDKNARQMQTNLEKIQQQEEMKANLLKGLAGLLL